MRCLQCDSSRIVEDTRCIDRGESHLKHSLTLEVYANPEAWIFKDPQQGILRANVCADCGFVMFNVSVADAQKLERHKK